MPAIEHARDRHPASASISIVGGWSAGDPARHGRRHARRPTAPAARVALGGTEREKINYLNGFVRGGLLNLREKRRLPIRL